MLSNPPIVDLQANTVNGKRVMPRIAQLVALLAHGRPVRAPYLAQRMYRDKQPKLPYGALRQTAWLARRHAGLKITCKEGRPKGACTGAPSPGSIYQLME